MKKLPEAIEFPAAFWGGRFVKLRFVEAFDGWIFTRMIVVIVTSHEPLALGLELVSIFDANAPPSAFGSSSLRKSDSLHFARRLRSFKMRSLPPRWGSQDSLPPLGWQAN